MSIYFVNLMNDVQLGESEVLTNFTVEVPTSETPGMLVASYGTNCLRLVPEGSALEPYEKVVEFPELNPYSILIATPVLGFVHNYLSEFYAMKITGGYLVIPTGGILFVGPDQSSCVPFNFSYTGNNADLAVFMDRDTEVAFKLYPDRFTHVQYVRNYYDTKGASLKVIDTVMMDNGWYAYKAEQEQLAKVEAKRQKELEKIRLREEDARLRNQAQFNRMVGKFFQV